MPEIAELRLMADYINRCSDTTFTKVIVEREKFPPLDIKDFNLKAKSRGKELMITMKGDEEVSIRLNLGMTGCFKKYKDRKSTPGGTAITFCSDEYVLAFVDVRRFARCVISTEWGSNRGPCVLSEYHSFKKNLLECSSRKIFDKEIYLLMMDQKYFNGIGNYLRSEILFRWDSSPFTCAREAIQDDRLIKLCYQVSKKAYRLGGGELYTWQTPEGTPRDQDKWDRFMKCYNQPGMASVLGPQDRRFWFNPKFS